MVNVAGSIEEYFARHTTMLVFAKGRHPIMNSQATAVTLSQGKLRSCRSDSPQVLNLGCGTESHKWYISRGLVIDSQQALRLHLQANQHDLSSTSGTFGRHPSYRCCSSPLDRCSPLLCILMHSSLCTPLPLHIYHSIVSFTGGTPCELSFTPHCHLHSESAAARAARIRRFTDINGVGSMRKPRGPSHASHLPCPHDRIIQPRVPRLLAYIVVVAMAHPVVAKGDLRTKC